MKVKLKYPCCNKDISMSDKLELTKTYKLSEDINKDKYILSFFTLQCPYCKSILRFTNVEFLPNKLSDKKKEELINDCLNGEYKLFDISFSDYIESIGD